jgi:hypothetical protein
VAQQAIFNEMVVISFKRDGLGQRDGFRQWDGHEHLDKKSFI